MIMIYAKLNSIYTPFDAIVRQIIMSAPFLGPSHEVCRVECRGAGRSFWEVQRIHDLMQSTNGP